MSIRTILADIKEELQREKQLFDFLELRREMVPPGSLVVNKYRNDEYYYQQIFDNGKRNCIFLDLLADEHREIIMELMEKKTIVHGLPILKNNIKAMERCLRELRPYHPTMFKYGDLLSSDYYLEGDVCVKEWKKKAECRNPYHRRDLVHDTKRGVKVRSKSEVLISDTLYDNGLLYKNEAALTIGGRTVYPDFEILHPKTHELVWWEHLGRADDASYMQGSLEKLEEYGDAGINLGKNLIVTFETKEAPLTRGEVLSKMRKCGLI